jgi:hypothetical protein
MHYTPSDRFSRDDSLLLRDEQTVIENIGEMQSFI